MSGKVGYTTAETEDADESFEPRERDQNEKP